MEGVRPWRPSWARLSWNDCEEGEPKHYLLSANDLIAAALAAAIIGLLGLNDDRLDFIGAASNLGESESASQRNGLLSDLE